MSTTRCINRDLPDASFLDTDIQWTCRDVYTCLLQRGATPTASRTLVPFNKTRTYSRLLSRYLSSMATGPPIGIFYRISACKQLGIRSDRLPIRARTFSLSAGRTDAIIFDKCKCFYASISNRQKRWNGCTILSSLGNRNWIFAGVFRREKFYCIQDGKEEIREKLNSLKGF